MKEKEGKNRRRGSDDNATRQQAKARQNNKAKNEMRADYRSKQRKMRRERERITINKKESKQEIGNRNARKEKRGTVSALMPEKS